MEKVIENSEARRKRNAYSEEDKEGSKKIKVSDEKESTPESNDTQTSKKDNLAVSLDCEFVGIRSGGVKNMLARVYIVNENYDILLDYYVKPTETVVDYRTNCSGIRASDLTSDSAKEFSLVRKEVQDIIKNRIVIGHDPTNDWEVLNLTHPQHLIRDTSTYLQFRRLNHGKRRIGLKMVTKALLKRSIQEGEHDSVVDAKTIMELYKLVKVDWEKLYAKTA